MSTLRTKSQVLYELRQGGIVPVIRAASSAIAVKIAEALVAGGITTLEITMTVPDALAAIREVRARFAERVLLGAGTVTSRALAEGSLKAGAEFLVTEIEGVLEDRQTRHQPRRQRRHAGTIRVDLAAFRLDGSPRDSLRQIHQLMIHVDNLIEP